MALSDLAVRQAKTTGKDYTLPDIDGLSLAISPVGGKSWHFRYYWAGKQKRMSLGTYPEVSLRDARSLRDEARVLIAKNINPKIHRKQKRQAVRLAAENSFNSVYLEWLEHRKLDLKEGRQSTLSQIQRIFIKDILPRLGEISIYDIRRSDLLEVVAKIEQRKALTVAEKVRTWFKQMFRFAMVKINNLEVNPASDLDVVAVPLPPVVNNPFLRLPELPELLRKLRNYKGRLTTQLGVRLLLLTGVRTGELRYAEPTQFDLDNGLWIIPPEIVKQLQDSMRKQRKRAQDIPPYIVPLSAQAIEIIRYLLQQVKPAQRYLLPNISDLKKRISENTLNAALQRMGYKDSLTGHGIRATISTALNEIGYPKMWVDSQLSHADPDKVSATYNHAQYVEQRRRMMQDWADRLDLLEQGYLDAACTHLNIRIDGMPVVSSNDTRTASLVVEGVNDIQITQLNAENRIFQRLSPLPEIQIAKSTEDIVVSDIQRERQDMLAIYESSQVLPISTFAKLAGKSRDQINREIKAGKLLALTMGNRGQRIPDWQLNPVKSKLTSALLEQVANIDPWELYRALSSPHDSLGGYSIIDVALPINFHEMIQLATAILREQVVGP